MKSEIYKSIFLKGKIALIAINTYQDTFDRNPRNLQIATKNIKISKDFFDLCIVDRKNPIKYIIGDEEMSHLNELRNCIVRIYNLAINHNLLDNNDINNFKIQFNYFALKYNDECMNS